MASVLTLYGKNPGKTVSVIVGTHGNEICGPKALEKLLPEISVKAGKVHFIYGNPRAIEQNVRQTEMNLNRAFRPDALLSAEEKGSYERGRALEIMAFLDESEALLDIHSSTSKDSTPFIICEKHSFSVAESLPFPIISYGWDLLHPGSTDYYMNNQNKVGICVECGTHLDPKAVPLAQKTIEIFLAQFGILDNKESSERIPQRKIHAYKIHRTQEDFTPAREFADFEKLKKDEFIGTDGEEKIFNQHEGDCILFCRKRDTAGQEAFVLGCDLV